jgi:hypothetical protein
MTRDEVLQRLRSACDEAGSAKAWAAAHNVSAPYVSDVLQGNRPPGDGILKGLGLKKRVVYDCEFPEQETA